MVAFRKNMNESVCGSDSSLVQFVQCT